MIQIPITLAVAAVVILHTILTHLSNWGIRKTNEDPIGLVIILFSLIETVIIISLICNMKQV